MPNKTLLTILKNTFRVVKYLDKRSTVFESDGIDNILIINTTAIGDTLLSTPAIWAIRNGFSEARITVLASSVAKAVLLNNPNVDEIIEHPGKVDLIYALKFPKLLRKLKEREFDLAVILHANDPDAAPLAYLSGAPHRVGWTESKLSFLHTIPVKTRISGVHTIDVRLGNLAPLGIHASNKKIEMHLSKGEERWADAFFQKQCVKSGEVIGIHPFGSKLNKRWPIEHVVEFCRHVDKEHGYTVIIFGGQKEAPIIETIARESKNLISVAGKLDIRESASIIGRCRVFVSTDSGPMHIAQAMEVPTIALFGPDDPLITGPITGTYEVIQKDIPCVPCRSKSCEIGVKCMKNISPQEVISVLRSFLSEAYEL